MHFDLISSDFLAPVSLWQVHEERRREDTHGVLLRCITSCDHFLYLIYINSNTLPYLFTLKEDSPLPVLCVCGNDSPDTNIIYSCTRFFCSVFHCATSTHTLVHLRSRHIFYRRAMIRWWSPDVCQPPLTPHPEPTAPALPCSWATNHAPPQRCFNTTFVVSLKVVGLIIL